MFRKSHCAAVPLAPTNITNASKYISFTSAYIAYRDLELHRSTAAASNSILVNGGATTTTMSSTTTKLGSLCIVCDHVLASKDKRFEDSSGWVGGAGQPVPGRVQAKD